MDLKKCEIAEFCGGCKYQGVDYRGQLADKDKNIRILLQKHKIDSSIYEGIVPSFSKYGYRNKMEYTFGDFEKGGNLELGMHRKKHFMSIVTSDMCQLVPEDFNKILKATLEFCRENKYSFYNKKTHIGLLRNLIIRHGVKTNELLVDIVTSKEGRALISDREIVSISEEEKYIGKISDNGIFDEKAYLERLMNLDLENEIIGVLHTTNSSLADAVIDSGTKILYGRDYYEEELLGLKFKVNIFAFFQTNIRAVERLYKEALELVPNIDGKIVYDLYCGTGTISELSALKAKEVYGIEISEDAVKSAISNTELNGIKNCHYILGDVKEKLDELKEKPDLIIVDPPRAGLHDKVVRMLASYGVSEILYISCNPKTLAMNIEQFHYLGYEPVKMRAYDNFPMTGHCETVVLLSKLNTDQHIDIEIGEELSEIDFSKDATYGEIKKFVLDKYGLKVSILYIAQIKRKHGLIERENYNFSKKENQRVPNCPEEKEKAIEDALEHFGMI